MLKKIKLNKEHIARLDNVEPFIVLKNEKLFLEIETFYDITNATITLKNGDLSKAYKLSKVFEVPNEFLFAGKLCATIDSYLDGKSIKRWSLLPIKVIEHETQIECFEQLDLIETKVDNILKFNERFANYSELVKNVEDLSEKHNKLVETVMSIQENY